MAEQFTGTLTSRNGLHYVRDKNLPLLFAEWLKADERGRSRHEREFTVKITPSSFHVDDLDGRDLRAIKRATGRIS